MGVLPLELKLKRTPYFGSNPMPVRRPLKISEKGAPLSCADHDANIDSLLARENHTGVQPASSIYDLKQTVLGYAELQTLLGGNAAFQAQIDALKKDVYDPDGYVQDLLSALRTELNATIAAESGRINSIQSAINTLTSRVDGLSARVEAQSSRLDSLTGRIAANDNDNESLWNAIGGRTGNRYNIPAPQWPGEVPGHSNLLYLQLNTETGVVYWYPPLVLYGGWLGERTADTTNLGTLDLGELKARLP
jgi:hypothetical protein